MRPSREPSDLSIDGFFETYPISTALGCRKPDPRMFRHASGVFGPEPAGCVFSATIRNWSPRRLSLGIRGS
jgi:hypothetical protein